MTGKKLRKIIHQLFLMCDMLKRGKIDPAYISKHNSKHEKQILFIIQNKDRWFAVKRLSALLKGITSPRDGDFYCLNCLHLI